MENNKEKKHLEALKKIQDNVVIELYAHKTSENEFSGRYTATVYLNGNDVARIDSDLDFHKVKFNSTLETRINGIDDFVESTKSLKVQEILNDERVILMNVKDLEIPLEKDKEYHKWLEAVDWKGSELKNVPDKYKNYEICELSVTKHGLNLKYVPEELITQELCELVVRDSGHFLEFIPEKFRTFEMCELAILNDVNGYALEFVPEELKTQELCELAIFGSLNSDGYTTPYAIRFVPEEFITPRMCKEAIRVNGAALGDIPEDLRTKELCDYAFSDACECPIDEDLRLEFIQDYVPYEFQEELADKYDIDLAKKTNEKGR